MEHVKCKSCGLRHPLGQCRGIGAPDLAKEPSTDAPRETRPKLTKTWASPPALEDKDAVIAELRAKIAKLEEDAVLVTKKREYQKALMRERRAKAKDI